MELERVLREDIVPHLSLVEEMRSRMQGHCSEGGQDREEEMEEALTGEELDGSHKIQDLLDLDGRQLESRLII